MRQRNSPSTRGREQPWLLRQFVRPVDPHIGERVQVPQALIIGGIIALMLVAFIFFYILAGQALGMGAAPKTAPSPVKSFPITPAPTRPAGTPVSSPTRASGTVPATVSAATSVPPTVAQPVAPIGATSGSTQVTGTKYKVQAGDTLSSIATKFGVSIQSIRTANNIKDDTIYAGEELVIPPRQ